MSNPIDRTDRDDLLKKFGIVEIAIRELDKRLGKLNKEQRYFRYNQVELEFQSLTDSDKVIVLFRALGIKGDRSGCCINDCIAISMGFEPCVSGSGFYERKK